MGAARTGGDAVGATDPDGPARRAGGVLRRGRWRQGRGQGRASARATTDGEVGPSEAGTTDGPSEERLAMMAALRGRQGQRLRVINRSTPVPNRPSPLFGSTHVHPN